MVFPSTFIFAKVQGILLVCDDLHEVDDALVVQLPQDLDFSDSRDREALFLVLKTHFLQGNKLTCNVNTFLVSTPLLRVHICKTNQFLCCISNTRAGL